MTGAPPGFWRTLAVLLHAVRLRAGGRRRRQRELLSQRTGRSGFSLGRAAIVLTVLLMAGLNGAGALVVRGAVTAGEQMDAERQGRVVVDEWFVRRVERAQRAGRDFDGDYTFEAQQLARNGATDVSSARRRLQEAVRSRGAAGLVAREDAMPGLSGLKRTGFAPMLGSVALMFWGAMLVFAGEGLELDVGLRRHPMWEWLFSHPAPPSAVFAAEMLSPLAANPVYWSAPLLPGMLYGVVYGVGAGVWAAVLVGVPLALAASCLGKALQIAVTLRAAPRSRGALIGLMSWLGSVSGVIIFFAAYTGVRVASFVAVPLARLADLPWPWLSLFLGQRGDGSYSFPLGVAACLAASVAVAAGSVSFSLWGAARGLSSPPAPPVVPGRRARFGRNALNRKELIWFRRDRGALVQVVLVPLTLAGVQLFNLRGFLAEARGGWNALCGAAVLLGTYFLLIVGPKSLASEGNTLWIAMTWPLGLEGLLKAKARLWATLSSVPVGLVLCYALWSYPAAWPGVVLVGAGWAVFARSTAAKAVTLATVTSSSGEVERIPAGRRWATQLGTLTFAVGVMTRQAPLAATGIVFSVMTSAAMWQNFRARLPFLMDPWSERLPPPPTLMHAMVAVSALVECGAVLTGVAVAFTGPDAAAVAIAVGYGLSAAGVALGTSAFLSKRGVNARAIWFWTPQPVLTGLRRIWVQVTFLSAGLGLGVLLGVAACGYLLVLQHIPWTADLLRQADGARARYPESAVAIFVVAVLFAPPAEEFLFRGLLFRALDREWSGWRAVAGSAAFFASYHPVLSWLPVGMLGAMNAVLFKRTGRLAPAVAAHVAYNAVVLGWQFAV